MPIGTTVKPVLQSWQFRIEINGFDAALFTKGQEPQTEFEEVKFSPAGAINDEKQAGRVTFPDLTFEFGQVAGGADQAAVDWMNAQVNATDPSAYMRDVNVVRTDRNGGEVRRFTLKGAWIKKLEYGEKEGGKSDPAISKLTLCYQSWT